MEQFKECSWWYYDGTQPITNGEVGLVVNEKGEGKILITSCGNCGDYSIIEIEELYKQ